MYQQVRQGAGGYAFNFAAFYWSTGYRFHCCPSGEQVRASSVSATLTLEVCSGSGRGGALAAPIHATPLAPEAGSDWLGKLKGCAWGFGWVCSNNSLSRQGERFLPLVQPKISTSGTVHDSESVLEPFSSVCFQWAGLQNTMTDPDLIFLH